MEWVLGTAKLPAGREGYARLVRLHDGTVVALVVTATGLPPNRRATVRRELLSRCLAACEGPADPATAP